MKHKKIICFLLILIIVNILGTLPFLFMIITGDLNGWLFKHLKFIRFFIYDNKFLSFVNGWRAHLPMIPQAYDLLIFGISLNYGIRALIERKKQRLNIKLEKILICLVGINMIISTFELFYFNLGD
jgi:hypothetical protein